MQNMLALLVLLVVLMCVVSRTYAFDQGLELEVNALTELDAEVEADAEEGDADEVLDEIALDNDILHVFRKDRVEDDKIMDAFTSIEETFVDTLNNADPELEHHDRELDRLKETIESEDANEVEFASLIEQSRNYSPELVSRVNEALKAHDITLGLTQLSKGPQKKVSPKIVGGLQKKSLSADALKKVQMEIALAPNSKKLVIKEGERLLEEFKNYQSQFEKQNGLRNCDEKEEKKEDPKKEDPKPETKPPKPENKPPKPESKPPTTSTPKPPAKPPKTPKPVLITKTIYRNKLVKLRCKKGKCLKHLPPPPTDKPAFFPSPFPPQVPIAPATPSADHSQLVSQEIKQEQVSFAHSSQQEQNIEQQVKGQISKDEQQINQKLGSLESNVRKDQESEDAQVQQALEQVKK